MSFQGPLGSAFLQTPATPANVPDLSPALCNDLSAFKALIASYRKLDDGITMRLNRSHALAKRDGAYADVSNTECEAFWNELLQVWRGRQRAISYCVAVTDARLEDKREKLKGEPRLDADRPARDDVYSEEVKRDQIARELAVESIVRRRSLSAFFSRCKGFSPPQLSELNDLTTAP